MMLVIWEYQIPEKNGTKYQWYIKDGKIFYSRTILGGGWADTTEADNEVTEFLSSRIVQRESQQITHPEQIHVTFSA